MQQLWTMNADGNNQTLLAGNGFGDYSPSWNTVSNQPPVANSGGPYNGVVAQNVSFSGSGSFDPDGSVSNYSWSFGDGGSGSGVSLTHTYASSGTYSVVLTVTDNLGAQTSATTTTSITTAASEQYLANFNQAALARAPNANESSYWNDILRAAKPNGQSSMLLTVRELGKTLFESADYAARARDNHWYVYDLYKTYLMRDPDPSGWNFWEGQCNLNGREQVRRAFDECGEFAGIVATLTPTGAPSSSVSSLASARVDPFNQPGSGLSARDAEWSVPLLSLPGRAGLDLGLSLSYSSMVWTRSGPYIYFDEDNGWPGPGFRLGFPTIQEKVFDAQAGRNVYLLISGGTRVSLRQVNTSTVYEAADSSYLQLTDYGSSLLLRTTDGTQLSYQSFNSEWRCNQIKDRNGNYITVNYDWLAHIANVIDTLGRTINFNYDTNANLLSITQSWTVNGSPTTHTWASFGWTTKTIQPGFAGVMVVGATSGYTFPVINQVGLDDGTRYTFEYNSFGQVNPIRSFRSDNVQRAWTSYDYDAPGDDCPRSLDTHTWAENWTGINGVPQEVAMNYGAPGDGSHTVTTPDGTLYKEFYGGSAGFQPVSAWARGLVAQTEVWSGGIRQKWTVNTWTQDNTGVSYQTNPRVTETNVFDASGNHRRATVSYTSFVLPSGANCPLPTDKREYSGDASTVLRHAHVLYRMDPSLDASYLDRHIIGLVKEQTLFEINGGTETLMSKVGFGYDEAGSIQGNHAPGQHDNDNYSATFITGRANLSSETRFDVTDTSVPTVSSIRYNTAGGVVYAADALSHHTTVSYVDSFSDGNNGRNTLAYPKTITDADGYSSTVIFNFDFGAVTSKQTPQPNTTQNLPGPVQTIAYDAAGRMERVTATTNSAYTRYVYGPNYLLTLSTVNNAADEGYSSTLFDGLGRTIIAASNHPGSAGGYSAVNTIYDFMGQAVKQSNPTETNGAWVPYGEDAAGWLYTQQTYDCKGRPLVTTNTDLTTKEASYSGCGCARGEVVTLTDEGTIDSGMAKRRQQKVYSDVLGRSVKTEIMTWQGGSAYSTTLNTYNGLDQLTHVRQFDSSQGTVPSDPNDLSCPTGSCQQTTMTYDGFGRLKMKHVPEQDEGTATTWNYNADDTLQSVIDARGASQSLTHNARGLVTGINYSAPSGIAATAPLSVSYDAAGNRTSLSDGSGSCTYNYDQLSRVTSETHTFSGLSGSYPLSYEYNLAGELKKITDPTNATIDYNYDLSGRVNSITAENNLYAGVSQYASGFVYRAWGGIKGLTYGNNYTLGVNYNSRLQATQFEVAGRPSQFGSSTVMRTQFNYYSDGATKYAHDTLDERYDRAFSYDQVSMLKEAYTGSESRDLVNGTSSGTQTGPYRQTYQHDALGNMTQKDNRFWSQSDTLTAGYANNRKQGFNYDAAGNLLADADIIYSYDAAGRNVSLFGASNNRTISVVHDGDGAVTKRTELQQNTQTLTYYVRSSVLGGRIVAELNQSGQKQKGYVFANGQLLAEQANNVVNWRHENPVTGSQGISSTNGGFAPQAEPDPTGVNVGFEDPYINCCTLPEPNADQIMPMLLGSFGSGHCSLDGMSIDCGWAMQMLASGSAVQCPNNDCGPRSVIYQGQRTWAFFNAYGDGFQGYVPMGASYIGNGNFSSLGSGLPHLNNNSGHDTNFSLLNGATGEAQLGRTPQFLGIGFGGVFLLGIIPQNPTPVDKLYGWWGDCNRSANDLMRTIRRDFSKFGNFSEPVAGGLGVAGIKFDSGPITQGRNIGITVGAFSTVDPSISYSRSMSVTVSSASTSSFTFTTNPGHVFYPGTISFSANDTASGVRFSISLKGELGDRQAKIGFGLGGGSFEDDSWKHFLGLVRESCGNAK